MWLPTPPPGSARRWAAAAVALALGTGGCSAARGGADAAVPARPPVVANGVTPGGGRPGAPVPQASPADADQALAMMDDLTSVFEYGAVSPQYTYIRDQHDGCGYTAGWIGFCTAYGDLLDVVKAYDKVAPANGLRRYETVLARLYASHSEDTRALGSSFPADWRHAAADPAFRRVQIDVGHANYLTPARAIARREGITTPLGLEFLFDTALMMGPSKSACDGVLKLTAETDRAMRGNPASGVPEAQWLTAFSTTRIRHLRNPCTPGRQADWPRAVGRARALQSIADAGNWRLTPPLRLGGGYQVTITRAVA